MEITPGPWDFACDSNKRVRHSKKACVYATLESPRGDRLIHIAAQIPNWSDARLIAAAPDMLAALQQVSEECADLSGLLADRHAIVMNDIRNIIDNAIAKARGEK